MEEVSSAGLKVPAHDFVSFTHHQGFVACYTTNDIVCSEVRRHGVFEPDVLSFVTRSADRLRQQVAKAKSILRTRFPNKAHLLGVTRDDVVYMDVGGNVGVFAMTMWRRGFQTMIFEAMPSNAALLRLSICLNRAEASKNVVTPLVELHHVALGPQGAEGTCTIISDRKNVGDGQIDCDEKQSATYKSLVSAGVDPSTRGMRGIVSLNSLSTLLWGDRNASEKQLSRRFSSANVLEAFELPPLDALQRSRSMVSVTSSLRDGEYLVRGSAPLMVTNSWSNTELIDFVSQSHVVMKIDVEGFEHMIMKGAHQFLSSHLTRPKVIVSEIWKTRDVVAYCGMMIHPYGYAAYVMHDRRWIRFVSEAKEFHANMAYEIGTMIFVDPGFEYLILDD
jgi:hypothetical protein